MRLLSLLFLATLVWLALIDAPVPAPASTLGPLSPATQQAPSAVTIEYQRDDWPHWIDEDGDCQNTRQELLIITSQVPVRFTNERECTVASGQWLDPYTGNTYTLASDLDIDHVVPLAYANDVGGNSWTREQRQRFANDTRNLLVVDDGENQRKGAAGPSGFMPQVSFRREYLQIWQDIIVTYGLRLLPEDSRLLGI